MDAVFAAAVAEVAATGVTGNAAMGKVMAIVKPKLAGKADMSGAVSGKVKAKLASRPLRFPASRSIAIFVNSTLLWRRVRCRAGQVGRVLFEISDGRHGGDFRR